MGHEEKVEEMLKKVKISLSDDFKEKSYQYAARGVDLARHKHQRKQWRNRLFTITGSVVLLAALMLFTFQFLLGPDNGWFAANDPSHQDNNTNIHHSGSNDPLNSDGQRHEDIDNDANSEPGHNEVEGSEDELQEPADETPAPTDPGLLGQFITYDSFSGGTLNGVQGVKEVDWAAHQQYERLVFRLFNGSYGQYDEPADIPNLYEVHTELYPHRLVYTLSDMHGQSVEPFIDLELNASSVFRQIALLPTFDASELQLALDFSGDAEFYVAHLQEPARIVTDARLIPAVDTGVVYSLRTSSHWMDEAESGLAEKLIFLQELEDSADFNLEQIRIVHSAARTLFAEVGYFEAFEDAENMRNQLLEAGLTFDLYIEERGMYDVPAFIWE